MLTPDQILTHTYSIMPRLTNRFGTAITPIGSMIDATGLLNINGTYTVGEKYFVSGITLKNTVMGASGGLGNWTIETAKAHRITAPKQVNDKKTFKIVGNGWDGEHLVTGIPNRTTIKTSAGVATSPIGATILEQLDYEEGFIECVASGAVSKFRLNDGYAYECDCDVSKFIERLNVVVVPDIDRASAHYEGITPTQSLWAYLIMGDRVIVANKNTQAGLQGENRGGIENLFARTNFSVVVVWPRGTDEHLSAQINEAHGVISALMNRTFYGARFGGAYSTVPVSSGMSSMKNNAQYAHAYEFEVTERIDSHIDGIMPEHLGYSVPLRDVDYGLFVNVGDTPQKIGNVINLDEVL